MRFLACPWVAVVFSKDVILEEDIESWVEVVARAAASPFWPFSITDRVISLPYFIDLCFLAEDILPCIFNSVMGMYTSFSHG